MARRLAPPADWQPHAKRNHADDRWGDWHHGKPATVHDDPTAAAAIAKADKAAKKKNGARKR